MAENHNSVVNEFISEIAREKPQEFSYEQLKSFTSNFQFRIGFGGFGEVYKGEFPDGVQVAVKVLKNTMMDVMKKQFMSEVGTMGRTYHRNIIKLYGFCFDVQIKALVYEYMENGSFDRILYENEPDIKWGALYNIAIDIAKGLSYLHEHCSPQIIHHDIKPANVLLDSNLCPKIADFGLAKLNNKGLSHFTQTGYRGTPAYAAPEVNLNHPSITCKCDVYSFGIMSFDILGRKKYSEGEEWFPPQVWKHFQNGQLDKIIMKCGIGEEDKENAEILCKVALLCAQFNAKDRPSMSTVVTMLKGEISPKTPKDNPFPYYVSSSDSRNRSDERLHGNVTFSSHGSSSSNPQLIQGAILNTPIVHDQRNMNQIQKYERLGDIVSDPKPIQSLEIVSSGDFDAFASRKSTTKKIVEALEDGKIGLIGVFGMPGVGKTMLLDAVSNKVKKERTFDEVVMVTVSQNPDLEKIQDNIATILDLRFSNRDNSVTKKARLNDRINCRGKKTLVVLDDVWERLEIFEVGILHKNVNKDCKVVFTTRDKGVCGRMESDVTIEVTTLTEEDSWQLFRKRAGGAPPHNSILPGVAKDIANECKGLPLAIATLGRALRDKDETVWNSALILLRKSNYEGMPSVFSSIKISYDFLSNEEKKMCFLFCCLYPEDYKIDTNNIFFHVMGEKLLRNADTFLEARSMFHLIVDELVSSCLLLRDKEGYVMMHDVVRDVAIKIASSKESNKFIVKAGMNLTEWPNVELGNCNRLSLMSNKITCFPPYQIKAPNLLTLCLNDNLDFEKIPLDFFEGMQNLTTLDLSYTWVKSLPQSFSCLKSLRVLCMDNCWDLVDISQIKSLDKLEILSFCNCEGIQSWESLGKLTTLKMLDLSKCLIKSFLLPKVISNLHRLEELRIISYNQRDSIGLSEIACFTRLSCLHVNLLTDECNSQVELPTHWKNLTEFIFMCNSRKFDFWEFDSSSSSSKEFLKKSWNWKKRMFLQLPSISVPNWIRVLSGWTNDLFLIDCDHLKSVDQLDPSGMFDNLKQLNISGCPSMTHLYSTASSCEAKAPMYAFRNLERLKLSSSRLVAFCDGTLPQGFFQNLKFLEVRRWDKVIILIPCNLLERLQNLEKLKVRDCQQMEKLVQLTSNATQSMSSSGPSFPIFPKLTELEIFGPSFPIFPKLTELEIFDPSFPIFPKLTELEIFGPSFPIFPKLKELEILRELEIFGPSFPIFPKLRELDIYSCNKLKYLLPMRVLRELRQLEILHISHSSSMVMIVEQAQDKVVDVDQDKAILPRLKSLYLYKLPELMSFCPSSLLFDWPALECLWVDDCPRLKRLPLHTNSAPKLRTLDVGQRWFDRLEWEDQSLKSRLQSLLLTQKIQLNGDEDKWDAAHNEAILKRGEQVTSVLQTIQLFDKMMGSNVGESTKLNI